MSRRNVLWPLLIVGVAIVLLLNIMGVLPPGLFDMVQRAAPALLVVVGLVYLLRQRVPLSGFVALILTVVLVGGVAVASFSSRETQRRTDNVVEVDQLIDDDVSLIQINIDLLTTDLNILPAIDETRTITGEFVGSEESVIQVEYINQDDGRATFTLREDKPDAFPMLASVGRGELSLRLPPGVPMDIAISGEQGVAVINANVVSLERLNLNWREGDALVTLPDYEPLSPTVLADPGNLTVLNGDISIVVPLTIDARLELDRGLSNVQPEFNEITYRYLQGDVLEDRDYEDSENTILYQVTAPRGVIRIEDGS